MEQQEDHDYQIVEETRDSDQALGYHVDLEGSRQTYRGMGGRGWAKVRRQSRGTENVPSEWEKHLCQCTYGRDCCTEGLFCRPFL